MSNQLQVSGEAKIRAIQGPVVANSGVITALNGNATQYVRGDGALADFPTSTGGGSSVSYYLNSSISQGTIGGVAYKQLSKVPISGAGTDITTSANGYIASYITDANDPALLEVPAGNFNCEFYFSVNSNAHNPYVYAELYKYDGTTFTLLGSNVAIPEYLTNGTTLSAYYFAIPVAVASLNVTDRLSIRIYVNVDGRTVTLHTENNHLCQVVTTFSKGLISLNNLTRQNQFFATGTSGTDFAISSTTATHTFNLPVASASNTGKLSSTDWTTFNNKQNLLTNPVTGTGSDGRVAFWTGASSISSDANLYYDYSTDRLGIGTNTPNASLGILNASSTGIQVRTSDSANQYQANIYYDSSFGMVYGYNRLGTVTASNLSFYNSLGGFISVPESSNNNIGFNTLNPQGSSGTSVYDFTSLNTNVEIRLHNSSTGYTSTDGSFIKVTSSALSINNAETSQDIYINNGGNNAFRINGTNKVGIGDFSSTTPTEQLSVAGSIQQTGITSTMVKANSVGKFIAAVGGTDYEYPLTFSSPLVRTTNTISIPAATTSVSGYLTSTDWNTFNNKGSGTVTSVSGTAPVVSSGGATPNISMAAATTSVSGYLTSTDWTTFNNKFTLPSLTQGSILFSNGSTIAQNNSKLYWDNTNMRLGIGSQSVAQYVTYIQANTATNANAWVAIDNPNTTGSTALRLILNGGTTSGFQYVQSTNMTQIFANAGDIQLINGSSLGLTIANTTGNATFSASATATSFVKSGGTSSQFLKADGSVDSNSYYLASNPSGFTSNTGTVTSVATSAPLTGGTITTSGTIGITQATTSANGYLSSTDWNTFNGKFTLPSLTSGSVLFSNGSTIAQDNANFFWDDVNNRLGIGTSAPEQILHILGASPIVYIDGNSAGTQTSSTLRLRTGGFNVGNFRYNVATDNIEISNISAGGAVTSGAVKIFGTGGSTTGLTITSPGNVLIGTYTDNGNKLQVNGTGYFAAKLTIESSTYDDFIKLTRTGIGSMGISATNPRGIQTTDAAGNFVGWHVTAAGNVGIGTTTPNKKLELNTANGVSDGLRITYNSVVSEGLDITYLNSGNTTISFDSLYNSNSAIMQFRMKTNGAPLTAMTILGGGNILIGTTSGPSDGKLVISNGGAEGLEFSVAIASNENRILSYNRASNTYNRLRFDGLDYEFRTSNTPRLTITSAGAATFSSLAGSGSRTVTADASGTLSASSDSSLKQEDTSHKIEGLAEILQLQPRAYKWLSDIEIRGEEATTEIGFFADEVNPIIPSAAPKGNDDLYGFYDRAVIAALVKGMQEQQIQIQNLQEQINELKNK